MKVFRTLTVFMIISISNIVKSNAGIGRINLEIRGTPKCFHLWGEELSFIGKEINVTAALLDTTHRKIFFHKTGECDKQITITGNFPDDVIKKKEAQYVGYYYGDQVKIILKKFPEDCKSKYDGKSSDYTCDLGELDPNSKKGMNDTEFGKYLHDILRPMKLLGG
uniref:Uncharacterized protein n=1 Tax=Strongyloides papillosus TaxID=174720 RepID=A0A0N5B7T7_STREA